MTEYAIYLQNPQTNYEVVRSDFVSKEIVLNYVTSIPGLHGNLSEPRVANERISAPSQYRLIK